jgi:exopolyphosphatase/guanosine-5'-triphosphate,3'-diphosphate pyrophosphatase
MFSAAIDVGSNTIRMLIGSFKDNKLHRIYTDRVITRLAQGTAETGRLSENSIAKSVSVLKSLSQTISRYGAAKIKAVGTSAVREAENSKYFIDRAFNETGIHIETISGIREAELSVKGVLIGLENIGSRHLIIDIGGGSTEWIMYDGEGVSAGIASGTIPMGAVKLLERFIVADPPSPDILNALDKEIEASLKRELPAKIHHEIKTSTLIGTGGTITTLAAIDLELAEYDPERVHMHAIPIEKLYAMRDMLISLPLRERANITGLEPGRADLIIPGIMLTIKILELAGFDELTVSDYGLLEGILKEISDEEGF